MSLEKPRRTPEGINVKEAINAIQSIDTGSEQRAQLILVRLGLKPAAELNLYPWNAPPEEAETLLDKTALKYIRRDINRQQNTSAEYAVARDEQTAESLLHSSSSAEFGTLMGYPETAIQAFKKKELYRGPLPEDIENSIFKLKFSQEHFTEEFETVRKWNEALLEYAPDLIKHYHDNL